MEAIRDTIKNLLSEWKAEKPAAGRNNPEALLKRCLTKKELGHIKVNYFKKGTLAVNVDSSSWLYQLSLKKEGFLEKLRQHSGQVKDIRFRLGDIK